MQKLLRDKASREPVAELAPAAAPVADTADEAQPGLDVFRLIALRNRLAAAIEG
ncbi:MAG: hypothetical protein LC713_07690 [Actinobacteria bacterium]|nr:hypothetical protein [Actinomycetota bacterium]